MGVYVTGITGFIGSALRRRLLEEGFEVHECRVDITNAAQVKREILSMKPSVVVHLAAIVSTPWADEADWYAFDVNVKGTYNVAKYSKMAGARFIYASSTSVYRPTDKPITEESEIRPTTVYNLTKYMGEEVTRNIYGDDCLILRFSHIYGPEKDHCSIPLKVIRSSATGYPAVILASPDSVRSYLYIDDLVDLLLKVIDSDLTGVYNVSSDEYMKLSEVVSTVTKKIEEKGGNVPIVVWRPESDYMGTHMVVSEKIKQATGWRSRTPFERGVEICVSRLIP